MHSCNYVGFDFGQILFCRKAGPEIKDAGELKELDKIKS